MEKAFYKIETRKDGNWFASLFLLGYNKGIKTWEFQEQVEAESYSKLQFEMANAGFIDKLNQN